MRKKVIELVLWHKVKLPRKFQDQEPYLPELELVAKAQEAQEQGLKSFPKATVVYQGLVQPHPEDMGLEQGQEDYLPIALMLVPPRMLPM